MIWRRRREGKTNYVRRKKALLSRKPLLSVFISNKNIYAQMIKPEINGDKVLVHANSVQLYKMGWPYSRKNVPAAYLIGLMLGKRAKKAGIEEAILYTGVKGFIPGSRIAAVVKGALDMGVRIPFDDEALPSEERIKGEHIVAYFNMLREQDLEAAKKRFSKLWDKGLDKLPELINEFKVKIMEDDMS
jgi:large subunit ribosomal protein L18